MSAFLIRYLLVTAIAVFAAAHAQAPAPAKTQPEAVAKSPARSQKSKEPWEYLKEPAFKQAYTKALGPKSKTAWLVRRDGPAPEDKFVTIGGERYVKNAFCANHACKDNSAVLLYHPEKKAVYGTIYEKGKTTYIGDPPAAVATELAKMWKAEWRGSSK